MAAVLLYGDTIRYPAVRHEVPLEIVDAILFVADDDERRVLTSSLEAARIAAAVPGVELLLFEELGFFELIEAGKPYEEAELEVVVRALKEWAVADAVVPADLPVAVADRLREAAVGIEVDAGAIQARRRAKTPAELAGIRRAQRAAEAGMATGEELIRGAERVDGRLQHDGEPLTAEQVRAAIRAAAPLPARPRRRRSWSSRR